MKKDIVNLSNVKPITFVSSGIPEIDELVGGYPRARVSIVYGLAAVGKTSLLVRAMANASATHKILYCDVENAVNIERFTELGAKIANVDYTSLSTLEDVCELIKDNINKYDMIILDSVAMLVPRTEVQGESGESHVGLKPRLIGQWLRMIEGSLGASKTALVLINQMRRNIGGYGEPFILPGGMQLTFSSSLTLMLSTINKDRITDKQEGRIGHWITVEVKKSKVGKPGLTTRVKLLY